MHYAIDYKNKPERQALIDMIQFIGMRRYKLLARYARSQKKRKQVAFFCNFTGVQGKPVDVFEKRYSYKPQIMKD